MGPPPPPPVPWEATWNCICAILWAITVWRVLVHCTLLWMAVCASGTNVPAWTRVVGYCGLVPTIYQSKARDPFTRDRHQMTDLAAWLLLSASSSPSTHGEYAVCGGKGRLARPSIEWWQSGIWLMIRRRVTWDQQLYQHAQWGVVLDGSWSEGVWPEINNCTNTLSEGWYLWGTNYKRPWVSTDWIHLYRPHHYNMLSTPHFNGARTQTSWDWWSHIITKVQFNT